MFDAVQLFLSLFFAGKECSISFHLPSIHFFLFELKT